MVMGPAFAGIRAEGRPGIECDADLFSLARDGADATEASRGRNEISSEFVHAVQIHKMGAGGGTANRAGDSAAAAAIVGVVTGVV